MGAARAWSWRHGIGPGSRHRLEGSGCGLSRRVRRGCRVGSGARRNEVGCVHGSPAGLGGLDKLEHHREGCGAGTGPAGDLGPQPDGDERRRDGVPQMDPVLGVERQQLGLIVGDLLDGLGELRRIAPVGLTAPRCATPVPVVRWGLTQQFRGGAVGSDRRRGVVTRASARTVPGRGTPGRTGSTSVCQPSRCPMPAFDSRRPWTSPQRRGRRSRCLAARRSQGRTLPCAARTPVSHPAGAVASLHDARGPSAPTPTAGRPERTRSSPGGVGPCECPWGAPQ